jgi:hypothetical protein
MENNLKSWRTKRGLITTIYSHQRSKSRERNHELPDYSREELEKWLSTETNFNKLFDDWVKSNYSKWKTPSVDRINDYKPYCFSNIRLVTWEENFYKHHKDRKEGRNNKHSKSVIGINNTTNEEKEYYSIREAARQTGANQSDISKVCKDIYKQIKGYSFKYKE